ncbi:MAG: DUF5798 family protein [Salinirussus sp.]
MGLGDTAKKLQTVIDAAEKLYSRMNEVIERLSTLREEVETTSHQIDALERELAEQRVLVEAIADCEGIDVEAVLENADLPEVDATTDTGSGTE